MSKISCHFLLKSVSEIEIYELCPNSFLIKRIFSMFADKLLSPEIGIFPHWFVCGGMFDILRNKKYSKVISKSEYLALFIRVSCSLVIGGFFCAGSFAKYVRTYFGKSEGRIFFMSTAHRTSEQGPRIILDMRAKFVVSLFDAYFD